jgi:hypothetical protein
MAASPATSPAFSPILNGGKPAFEDAGEPQPKKKKGKGKK